MLVRVQRVGTGVPGDPFRVPLPSYTLVADDVAGGSHVVDVPVTDFPPGFVGNPGLVFVATAAGNTIAGLPSGILAQWTAFLQARYGNAYNPVVR